MANNDSRRTSNTPILISTNSIQHSLTIRHVRSLITARSARVFESRDAAFVVSRGGTGVVVGGGLHQGGRERGLIGANATVGCCCYESGEEGDEEGGMHLDICESWVFGLESWLDDLIVEDLGRGLG